MIRPVEIFQASRNLHMGRKMRCLHLLMLTSPKVIKRTISFYTKPNLGHRRFLAEHFFKAKTNR